MATDRILDPEAALDLLVPLFLTDTKVPLTVTGNSMVPFLHHLKDRVLLRGVSFQKPKVGDILFFLRPDGKTFILHRIIKAYPDGSFRVCGDAQSWTELVSPGSALAVVTDISRNQEPFRSVQHPGYRVSTFLWRKLRPIRPQIFRFLTALRHKN